MSQQARRHEDGHHGIAHKVCPDWSRVQRSPRDAPRVGSDPGRASYRWMYRPTARVSSSRWFRPATLIPRSPVLDVQPADRHLLILVREEGEKHKYLCGHDERHFGSSRPSPSPPRLAPVRQAKEALKAVPKFGTHKAGRSCGLQLGIAARTRRIAVKGSGSSSPQPASLSPRAWCSTTSRSAGGNGGKATLGRILLSDGR